MPVKALFLLPLAALCCFAAEEKQAIDTHRSVAEALVNLLSETEICLNSCQDADSVAAAIPQLKELAAKAGDIAARQAALPAPTIQDDMAVVDLVEDFANLWQAIGRHIDRLQKAGLVTPELNDVLKLAPPESK